MIAPYVHLIAGLCVVSRVGDVATTYLVSPTLKLESNFIVRRLGWRFALLTIIVGLIPYYSPPLGLIVLTASFLVSASNASKILLARAIGEEELAGLMKRAFLSTPPWPALLFLTMPGLFVMLLGGTVFLFYPSATEWAYYFAFGLLTYAFAMILWHPIRYFRVRRGEMRKRLLQ
jgi:hypothetical protein